MNGSVCGDMVFADIIRVLGTGVRGGGNGEACEEWREVCGRLLAPEENRPEEAGAPEGEVMWPPAEMEGEPVGGGTRAGPPERGGESGPDPLPAVRAGEISVPSRGANGPAAAASAGDREPAAPEVESAARWEWSRVEAGIREESPRVEAGIREEIDRAGSGARSSEQPARSSSRAISREGEVDLNLTYSGERHPGEEPQSTARLREAVDPTGHDGSEELRTRADRADAQGDDSPGTRMGAQRGRHHDAEFDIASGAPESERGDGGGIQAAPSRASLAGSEEGEAGPPERGGRDLPPAPGERSSGGQLRRGDDPFVRLRVRDLDSEPLMIRLRASEAELVGRMQTRDASFLRDLSGDMGSLRRNLEGLGYGNVDLQLGHDGSDGREPPRRRGRQYPPEAMDDGSTAEPEVIRARAGTVDLLA
ncbi:MAG: hypothetical protein R6U70_09675 [Bacillota bacterium]